MLGLIYDGTGEPGYRLTRTELTTKILAPERLREAAAYERPLGYAGLYHWDDFYSRTPIQCMRPAPDIQTVLPIACVPNDAWKEQQAAAGIKPVVDVMDVKAPNGDTVSVAVDENGEVVATETQPDWLPLAAAAGLAWLFLT